MNSRGSLIEKYEKSCQQFNTESTSHIFCQDGATNYGQWVIPTKCCEGFIEIAFGGEIFSCPKWYDEYLRAGYGDYMKLPPENERYNRHQVIEVKFPEWL